MGQFFGNTAENIFRSHIPDNENHLLIVVIQSTGIVGQGIHRLNGNGCAADQCFQKYPVIQFHSRSRTNPASGLGHIEYPFHIVGSAGAAIDSVIFLTGFQNPDTGGFLLNRCTGMRLRIPSKV